MTPLGPTLGSSDQVMLSPHQALEDFGKNKWGKRKVPWASLWCRCFPRGGGLVAAWWLPGGRGHRCGGGPCVTLVVFQLGILTHWCPLVCFFISRYPCNLWCQDGMPYAKYSRFSGKAALVEWMHWNRHSNEVANLR